MKNTEVDSLESPENKVASKIQSLNEDLDCRLPKFDGHFDDYSRAVHNLAQISKNQQYIEQMAFRNQTSRKKFDKTLEEIKNHIKETEELGAISSETADEMMTCYEEMERSYKNGETNKGNFAGDMLNMWAVTEGAKEVIPSEYQEN